MNAKLLSRDDFRNGVFKRDGYKCVICKAEGQDAHHLIERRLWPQSGFGIELRRVNGKIEPQFNGGYFLDNGATLCGTCHYEAEKTTLSVEDIRAAAGIKTVLLPEHLSPSDRYDKWGNIILPNGMRVKGELFHDESVQKILGEGGVLHLFQKWVKYPRTYHLPNSPGGFNTDEDKVLNDFDNFFYDDFDGETKPCRVIITEKRDGENTSIYTDYVHARSLTVDGHWSKNWIKAFQCEIGYLIPEGWRICGENLFAKHSIPYGSLETFFEGFSIWNEKNQCLPWDETLEWFELIGIKPVPILYDGLFSAKILKEIEPTDLERCEGYVVRNAKGFHYSNFRFNVGKWARANHVRTENNWKTKPVELNGLSESSTIS